MTGNILQEGLMYGTDDPVLDRPALLIGSVSLPVIQLLETQSNFIRGETILIFCDD